MVDISSGDKKINITVTSSGNKASVNATPDTAMYYSNKSREWAISNKIVDNEDYSSKYYANESKKQAETVKDKITEVNNAVEEGITNIINQENISVDNVNTAGATQVNLAKEQATIATTQAEIATAKTTEVVESGNNAITAITAQETTSKNNIETKGAEQITLIQNEGAIQIANVQSTGFYMRDDKLYFINSQGEETEFKSGGSGLEVCDIGMSLYVDETKGLRRYLNGQIVDRNANTEAFFTRLQEITTLHPSLLCTEDEWQTAKTMSVFGQVGKFVFNYSGETVVSVRIPRVVNVQGLFDLQDLGLTVEAGLPNITGYLASIDTTGRWGLIANASANNYNKNSGAFRAQNNGSYSQSVSTGKGVASGDLYFDASRSSSIYKDGAHVQQEAIQYPYFIQVATGSETENNIINDIELNNPFSLFDSKYSDHELNNISWLKSEGQWNSKAVYPTAYDKLLKVYNGTETVVGLSVKLSTEDYTDYDFVLNTADETFRLPLKNHTTDDGNSVLTLYYYVGETVQNANLINAGRIEEIVVTKADKSEVAPLKTAYITETYVNGKSWYRVYSDGFIDQGGSFYNAAVAENTITFLKPFTTNQIQVFKTPAGGYYMANSWAGHFVNIGKVTNTYFKSYTTNADGGKLFYWRACGY